MKNVMYEVGQERSKPFAFVSQRWVKVISNGNKYITVEGGHCSKYRKDSVKIFSDGNGIAYCPVPDFSDGKYDTLLFPEQWMAEVYMFCSEQVKEAQQVINKVGLMGLSTEALREICKCGMEEEE